MRRRMSTRTVMRMPFQSRGANFVCLKVCNFMSPSATLCVCVTSTEWHSISSTVWHCVLPAMFVSKSATVFMFFSVFSTVWHCVSRSLEIAKRSPLFLSECPPPQMTQRLLHIKSSANPAKSCHFPPVCPNNAFLPLPLALMPIEISHKCGEGEPANSPGIAEQNL